MNAKETIIEFLSLQIDALSFESILYENCDAFEHFLSDSRELFLKLLEADYTTPNQVNILIEDLQEFLRNLPNEHQIDPFLLLNQEDRLSTAFDMGWKDKGRSLNNLKYKYYLAAEFQSDYQENNDLTDFFLNHVPEFSEISAYIEALKKIRLVKQAKVLEEAFNRLSTKGFFESKQKWEYLAKSTSLSSLLSDLNYKLWSL